MSGLGDSVQPSAKGYSNSNLSMCKRLQTEMKVLHTGCYHRPSQSKDSSLPFTLPHPWQFGIEHSLRLPPIRIPGPKQMKVPFAHRTELFESFLPASLLSNPPSSSPGEKAGQETLWKLIYDALMCFTHPKILSTCFGLNCVPHPQFIC